MPSSDWTRRGLLVGSAALAVGASGTLAWHHLRQPATRVLAMRAPAYDDTLVARVREGIEAFPRLLARVPGANVLLKPNLVEVRAAGPVNTDPRLVAAAAAAFLELGARTVTVAEGPGHMRDTEAILVLSGLEAALRPLRVPFVDLNIAAAGEVPSVLTRLPHVPVAGPVLAADLVVSMPKLKTHHWAGVTLSMKNLFGTVPGAVFGWPKNPLHWAGIPESIVDLWLGIQPAFAIVDGIVGMEGDGPIMGTAVDAGVLFFGEDLPSVDATATRFMGLKPEGVHFLKLARDRGATTSKHRIEVMGDVLTPMSFAVVDHFAQLRG
jgi:uncharacterized protein (DUF362 family)